jgi:hypothetical protein
MLLAGANVWRASQAAMPVRIAPEFSPIAAVNRERVDPASAATGRRDICCRLLRKRAN